MKYITSSVLFLLFLLLITETSAQQYGRRGGKGDITRLERLNLSEEQRTKISEFRSSHQIEAGKLRDELDKLRIDKRAMLRNKNVDRNSYLNLERKMSNIRERLTIMNAEFRLNVHEILTDEQKENFLNNNFGRNRSGARFNRNSGPCWCR